jgi:hypothetical protein
MQRGIASILTLLFCWLLALPLFASSGELRIPACCRKGGKHHCMAMHIAQLSDAALSVDTVAEKCPCCPHSTTASHAQFCAPPTNEAVFAGVVRHPAVSPQTEASYRVSYDRSRQKRGPPSLILS